MKYGKGHIEYTEDTYEDVDGNQREWHEVAYWQDGERKLQVGSGSKNVAFAQLIGLLERLGIFPFVALAFLILAAILIALL